MDSGKMMQELLKEIEALSGVRFPVRNFVESVSDLQTRILTELPMDKEFLFCWRQGGARQLKWFREELVTIRTFLEKHGLESEFITVLSGNQHFDGKWESSRGEVSIEVTNAVDGHLESRLMEHLEKYGCAPSTLEDPQIIKQDRELSREYAAEATCVSTTIKDERKMIVARIAAKNSSEHYHGRYILLVGYSPGVPLRFEEVIEDFTALLPSPVFEKVFLVEPWKGILFDVPFVSH